MLKYFNSKCEIREHFSPINTKAQSSMHTLEQRYQRGWQLGGTIEVKNTWVHIHSNKQKSIYLLHMCISTHTHILCGFIYILKLLSLWYVINLSWTLRTHQFFYTSSFVAFIFFTASEGSDVTPSSILYYLFFSPTPSQRLNLEIMINLSLNAAEKSVEDEFGIPCLICVIKKWSG